MTVLRRNGKFNAAIPSNLFSPGASVGSLTIEGLSEVPTIERFALKDLEATTVTISGLSKLATLSELFACGATVTGVFTISVRT